MDFTLSRFYYVYLKIDIIEEYTNYFNVKLPGSLPTGRSHRFLMKYNACEVLTIFQHIVCEEMHIISTGQFLLRNLFVDCCLCLTIDEVH
jgi:hypothetical protein